MTSGHSKSPSATIDWDEVRISLRRRLIGQLDASERSELEDLIQEGCVRLLRASRREPIQDLEGLISVIAKRTFGDHLRRRYRHDRLLRPLDEGHADAVAIPGPDSRFGDLVDRIEFMVAGIFEREGRTECGELARGWFARRSWKEIAEELGLTHASVRKRWSRCLELPRRYFTDDPDLARLFEGE